MGTDLQMNSAEDPKPTSLFTAAVITTLPCSNRNTAAFSTEGFSFFNHSSHHQFDRGETAAKCAPTLAKTPRRWEASLLPSGVGVGRQRRLCLCTASCFPGLYQSLSVPRRCW